MIIQRVMFLLSENCMYKILFKSKDFFQIAIAIEFLSLLKFDFYANT